MNDLLSKIKIEKIKPLAIAGICFVAVFTAGYGTGRMNSSGSENATAKRSLNYTTNTGDGQNQATTQNSTDKPMINANTASQVPGQGECPIKGSKSKIYHMQGGAFYDRTNAVQCFATESEAQAAGYTKSSR